MIPLAFHCDQEPHHTTKNIQKPSKTMDQRWSKHTSEIHWVPEQVKQHRNVTSDATASPDSKKSQGKTCRNDGKVWLQRDAKRFIEIPLCCPATCEFESKAQKSSEPIDPLITLCRKLLRPSYTKGPQMHCLSTATCWQEFLWISLSFTSQIFGDAPATVASSGRMVESGLSQTAGGTNYIFCIAKCVQTKATHVHKCGIEGLQ